MTLDRVPAGTQRRTYLTIQWLISLGEIIDRDLKPATELDMAIGVIDIATVQPQWGSKHSRR